MAEKTWAADEFEIRNAKILIELDGNLNPVRAMLDGGVKVKVFEYARVNGEPTPIDPSFFSLTAQQKANIVATIKAGVLKRLNAAPDGGLIKI